MVMSDENAPVSPGTVLKAHLRDIEENTSAFCRSIGVSTKTLNTILQNKRGISVDLAIRLETATDMTALEWLSISNVWEVYKVKCSKRTISKTTLPESIQKLSPGYILKTYLLTRGTTLPQVCSEKYRTTLYASMSNNSVISDDAISDLLSHGVMTIGEWIDISHDYRLSKYRYLRGVPRKGSCHYSVSAEKLYADCDNDVIAVLEHLRDMDGPAFIPTVYNAIVRAMGIDDINESLAVWLEKYRDVSADALMHFRKNKLLKERTR